jgi:lysyl-tRNA synthetase class II
MEKLKMYNVIVNFTKTMTISINETGQVIFNRTMTFASGLDQKFEFYFDNSTVPRNCTLKIQMDIFMSVYFPITQQTWTKEIHKTIYTHVGDISTTNAGEYEVTLTGKLAQVAIPGTNVASYALEVDSSSWINPQMSITWSLNKTDIYLKVSDLTAFNVAVGDIVTVEGTLSRDASGNLWIDIENIEKVEVSAQ